MRSSRLASGAAVLLLGGCALLNHHITTTVSPVVGSDAPQLRLDCSASSTGRCYFRYRDAATGALTEYVVEAGRNVLVPDIPGPAKLCIWTSPVSGSCFLREHDVRPRGLLTMTF